MNSVHIIGNIVRQPELKFTQSGKSVTNFTVAVQDRYNKDNANYLPVVVWGKTAELCTEWLDKGKKVGITGRLTSRKYETQDGQKRTVIEIVADEVDFLTPKGDARPSSPPQQDQWSNLGIELNMEDTDDAPF